MKPKQEAPKKYPDIDSSNVQRLLKWITTTVSSTGVGVTYTQVKKFVDSTERKSSYDVKDVLKNFLENGLLQKVGYKYVLPQSPSKKQVAKKTIDKIQIVRKAADKKSPVITDAVNRSQTIGTAKSSTVVAEDPSQNTSAGTSAQNTSTGTSAQNTSAGTSAQNTDYVNNKYIYNKYSYNKYGPNIYILGNRNTTIFNINSFGGEIVIQGNKITMKDRKNKTDV